MAHVPWGDAHVRVAQGSLRDLSLEQIMDEFEDDDVLELEHYTNMFRRFTVFLCAPAPRPGDGDDTARRKELLARKARQQPLFSPSSSPQTPRHL